MTLQEFDSSELEFRGFSGSSVVKNPSDNAGDMGSVRGPGRSLMPESNYTHAPQLLSQGSGAQEPQLRSPCSLRAHVAQQEEPRQREAHIPQLESRSLSPQLEKNPRSNEDPAQPINTQNYFKKNLGRGDTKQQAKSSFGKYYL